MFNLFQGAQSRRRSRRQLRLKTEASRASAVERLEERALLASVPSLDSLAGAPVTLYLDFDGHTENSPDWTAQNGGQTIVIPPYDTDNDTTFLTDAEATEIFQIWEEVAEDFSPFNVNVTTNDPGSYNNYETILMSIGGRGFVAGAGGVAFLNSFSNSASNTAFTFSEAYNTIFDVASTISHEAGHTFGLRHHSLYDSNGTKQDEYHPGNGQYGPIMGAPFRSSGATRALWDDGPANQGTQDLQDDMAHMTRAGNRTFEFREDEHGDAADSSATSPDFDDDGRILVNSVIEQHTDLDYFRIDTDSGPISFTASTLDHSDAGPQTPGANLDVTLKLFDSAGNMVADSAPGNSFSASLNFTATQGTYYLEVGSEDLYGSVGQYELDGQINPLPTTPEMLSPRGITGDATPLFSWTSTASTKSYELQVNNLTTGQQNVIRVPGIVSTSYEPTNSLAEGEYQARVRSTNNQNKQSEFSDYLNFSIDVPPPGVPIPLSPRGRITDARPEFIWEAADQATSYELTVKDEAGNIVIFRTGTTTTTYRHFVPLNDGRYSWFVQAVNDVGEKGVPSTELDFRVEVARAEVPQITAPTARKTSLLRPLITWTPVVNAERYELRIHNKSTGENNVIREDELKVTEYRAPERMDQGTYRIDVRAYDVLDRFTKWSDPKILTIDVPLPAKPVLTGPSDTPVETQTPVFTWDKARRAKQYELVVLDKDNDDAQVLHRIVDATDGLEFQPGKKLPQSDNLVALLASINVVGERSDFDELEFGINVPAPKKPTVTGPRRNTNGTVSDTTPDFSWTSVNAAVSYDLRVRNRRTNKVVLREKSVKDTTFTPENPLAEEQQGYEVQVRARNSAGELSAWSKKYTFVLDVPTPETPDMYGPTGDTRSRRPTADWEHVDNASKYQLFVKSLNTNTTVRYNVKDFEVSDDGTVASYRIPDRLARGPYQVWVRALNTSNEKSGYSNQVTFTIVSSEIASPIVEPTATPAEAVTAPEAVEVPASTPDIVEPEELLIVETTQPAAPVQPTEQPAVSEESVAAAMADFADNDWWATEELAETTNDSETTPAVRIAAGFIALPVVAGKVLSRIRRRRKQK